MIGWQANHNHGMHTMKSKSLSPLAILMMASIAPLSTLPAHAAISIEANPYFEFHRNPINNPTGLRTRYFCDVTDQTQKSPTPYKAIPLELITIKNSSIVFEKTPNGNSYTIPREDTRIDCTETIMQ